MKSPEWSAQDFLWYERIISALHFLQLYFEKKSLTKIYTDYQIEKIQEHQEIQTNESPGVVFDS